MNVKELNHELGNIDIYLLDQILKDRFTPEMRILDAGCGEGRNLQWFLNNHFNVYGIDANPDAVVMLQFIVKTNHPDYHHENFIHATIEQSPFPDHFFDAVISSAVLHFSEDEDHFREMFHSMLRQLKTGGIFFMRSATLFGINPVAELKPGVYRLRDDQVRFLISPQLVAYMGEYIEWIEPVKSVIVNHIHSMGVFVGIKK